MNPIYPTDVTEKKNQSLSTPKKESKFTSLMIENEEDRYGHNSPQADSSKIEEKEDIPETLLLDGPYLAPFNPHQTSLSITKLIVSLPQEIQPLIKPLPATIQTSFKMGIMKTQMFIELPSSEKVEIIIDQYDTAPTAFHISFCGSETTNDLISQKQPALLSLLQKALPNFSFAISPPFLETPSFLLPKSKRLSYSPVNKGKHKK